MLIVWLLVRYGVRGGRVKFLVCYGSQPLLLIVIIFDRDPNGCGCARGGVLVCGLDVWSRSVCTIA